MADALSVLQQLRQRNPDITAAVLATNDGLAIHSDVGGDADADTLAATGADLAGRANHMAFDANHGEAHLLLVESDGGYILTARVEDSLCLVVTAKQEASLGLLLITVRKAAGEIPTDDV